MTTITTLSALGAADSEATDSVRPRKSRTCLCMARTIEGLSEVVKEHGVTKKPSVGGPRSASLGLFFGGVPRLGTEINF